MTQTSPPIGIDLGTSNSVIATVSGGDFEILENKRGDLKTPSVVSYDWDTDQVFVGKQAANRAVSNPEDTIQSIKRHMGDDDTFPLGNETHRPEGISALILKKLIQDAEEQLDRPVENAVITVPAYFSEKQRKATKKAGEIAGITVDRIISEPTAACLAYGLQTSSEKTVFVYDLGGGTLDCSIVNITDGIVEVEGVDGNDDLGGGDYDGLIVSWLMDQIEQEHGSRPAVTDPTVEARLFEAAKKAKHELTSLRSTTFSLPYVELEDGSTANFEKTLTRDTFKQITAGPTQETLDITKDFLRSAGVTPSDIDDVILVGGSTRMPAIQNAIEQLFGQKPRVGINPDTIVALGATAQACISQDIPVPSAAKTNITPKAEHSTDKPILGDDSQPVLVDVLPQTIGVGLADEKTGELYFQPLIAKNESIPAETEVSTTPLEDYQTHSTFKIYQGESESLEENELVDEFTLGPYPPKERDEASHRIHIHIDADGIINVEAVDEQHNIREGIQIDAEFELSESDMETMQSNLPALHE
ncbi:Hsp70 family protein [Haloarcula sp. Atlit-7R]|uniref:Hsp70 family protein n=1 Tax=Haloarcula sp. Atlit-7R TaxID=2282125 RepID=UPI000EF16B7B|nr:Hsp70 family protein [Haloarcula sp. Atlit-7R]RLM94346.1 Hsp70 family protein [Haloarcula sp. Atlit-7R]